MECISLKNIKFDSKSKEGIKDINKLKDLEPIFKAALVGGGLSTLFLGRSAEAKNGAGVITKLFASGTPSTAINLKQHDWTLFAKATKAIPSIIQNEIKKNSRITGSFTQ